MRPTAFLLILALACPAAADDNENTLTPREKEEGWILLFNGRDASGWKTSGGTKPAETVVEEGALMPWKSGGSVLVCEKPFGDFILKCDVKMPERCNSGIFFRIGNLRDPVQTGFEVQVMNSSGSGLHDFGAIYDLVPPSKNNLKPAGEWNSVTITCRGPHITVEVNGEKVAEMNCDEWTEPGKRPDGSGHKFRRAIKDFPRSGYLGFQDHGDKVWFRNVKLKVLDGAE